MDKIDFLFYLFFAFFFLLCHFLYSTFMAYKALNNLENEEYDLLKENLEKIAYFWFAFIIYSLLGCFIYFLFDLILLR
ncbi:Uncharacterised protein [Moraxella caprae]|uniref:Uncharacterized protein n=1 Tax=Moraxella caprae TaxID=90240 RepID=A0A378QZD9_9GAMM|nr:hypothetical protein [Moraxella caprae]STZ08295.1 Uncharacterised protein [Moraxella caprae]